MIAVHGDVDGDPLRLVALVVVALAVVQLLAVGAVDEGVIVKDDADPLRGPGVGAVVVDLEVGDDLEGHGEHEALLQLLAEEGVHVATCEGSSVQDSKP